MKGRSIPYNAEELAWIEANKQLPRREAHAAFCKQFNRSDVSLSNYNSLCKRKGWMTGRTGQFHQGQVSHNKGKKMPFHPNSARTQFKKGQLPHNTKYLGHERTTTDGYIEISIDQVNPHTGYERRYVLKHRHLWEQVNGPVPEGYALKSLDGDRTNTDPSNWKAIPRALLPRLVGGRWKKPIDDYEPELRPTVLTIAEAEHAAREAERKSRE